MLQDKLARVEEVITRAEDALTSAHMKDSEIEMLKDQISVREIHPLANYMKPSIGPNDQEFEVRNDQINETFESLLEKVGSLLFVDTQKKGQAMFVRARKEHMKLLKQKITLTNSLPPKRQ